MTEEEEERRRSVDEALVGDPAARRGSQSRRDLIAELEAAAG